MVRRKAKEKSTLNPREQVDLFLKRKEELWTSRAVRQGLNFSVTFEWNAHNNELTINTKEPDIEDFRSWVYPKGHLTIGSTEAREASFLTLGQCRSRARSTEALDGYIPNTSEIMFHKL